MDDSATGQAVRFPGELSGSLPNNSIEPPRLRFAPLAPCRGRSTPVGAGDLRPIPAGRVFGFSAILALAGRAAHLEAVRPPPARPAQPRSRAIHSQQPYLRPGQAALAGGIHGASWGFRVSLAYIAAFFLLSSLSRLQSEPLTFSAFLAQLPFGIFFFAYFGGLYGVLPASIVGALTGATVGALLALLTKAPSRRTTTLVAYIVAITLAVLGSAAFLVLYPDSSGYIFWIGIPCLIYLAATFPWSIRFHKTLFSEPSVIPPQANGPPA